MTTRRYGIYGSDMFKRYREQECISEYFKSKTQIENQIDELQKLEPRFFCRKCVTLKELIVAENKRFNKCYLSNSRQLKLIDNEDNIKSFTEECIEYQKCVHNRTPSVRKNVRSGRAPAGKAIRQSGGDSKTSKPEGSPIKGPPGQDQNRDSGKSLTKANPIPHNPDGINASHNSAEAQGDASKQITNPPISTSGRIETQEQRISLSAHPQVSETYSHASGFIEGTPNGEDHLSKPTQVVDLGKTTSQSDSLSGQIDEGHGDKNQDRGGSAAVTEIPDTGIHAVKGVGTNACSKIVDGEETCAEEAVIRESAVVPSIDVSTELDSNLDEFICSDHDFDELFGSETVRGEAPDGETSSSMVIDKEALGTVLPTVMLNTSTEEGTKLAFSSQGHMSSLYERDSELKICQSSGPIISSSGCNTLNRVAESSYSLKNEICSEEQKSKNHVPCRQDSHQGKELHQQNFSQQEGKFHYKVESTLQEEERSGIATSNGEEYLNDPDTTNIIDLIEKYKKYIISGLLPLVIFLLLFLLIKCTPLGTIFTKKKGRKRKEMNEKIQRVLSEPSATREGRIPFSYSAFEYSS